MLKMARYYFLLSWFQRTKKHIISLLVTTVLFLMSIFMFDDLIIMAESKGLLVLVKWIVLLGFFAMMGWNLRQIFSAISVPFIDDVKKPMDEKKEKILGKRELLTRSEQIYNKYKEAK